MKNKKTMTVEDLAKAYQKKAKIIRKKDLIILKIYSEISIKNKLTNSISSSDYLYNIFKIIFVSKLKFYL